MKKCIFIFSRPADCTFKKFSKILKKRVLDKMEFWQKQKNVFDYALKLRDCGDLYRFRVGEYRIICQKEESGKLIVLVVVKIGHRKDIYR